MKALLRALVALSLAALTLLLLDLNNRKTDAAASKPRIAVFKMASRELLDETERGIIDALRNGGYVDGQTCSLKFYCAEGDMPTANMIAQSIVSERFDMVLTISTPALQTMANANREGSVMHVFSAVTDPYASGVGITGSAPAQHPPHLVGIGTFQPVEAAIEIAKQMNPQLKTLGTVWCPGEVCSEACLRLARAKCRELGIDLHEASVENSTQVLEAAMSLTSQGVDALWLGGDNVVEVGFDQLVAASRAEIPLFTNNPGKVYGNTLFGLGAEYYRVGQTAGGLAVEVLNGKPTDRIGVENVVPRLLKLNPDALAHINAHWDISAFR